MPSSSFAHLTDRALIRVAGEDASHFLQNLVTVDIDDVDKSGAGASALLTPQGKILFDFLIYANDQGYLVDAPAATAGDLLKRLGFYRLRAKVELEILPENIGVFAVWGKPAEIPAAITSVADPRLADLGQRITGPVEELKQALGDGEEDPAAYEAHRIELAVPEGLKDYDYSDIFPHDADLDQLNGVSFSKGCYVGQEVVSRVHHRGTARKRFLPVQGDSALAEKGASITAGGKSIGTTGSSTQIEDRHVGLALLRLDKVRQAHDNDTPILCGDTKVQVSLPAWAGFSWPDTNATD
ncbi:MAG: folate-binding protein YgfZ [Roseibium sp.]|nr:folate-binding protein YgfZ [Roseibium sp.]